MSQKHADELEALLESSGFNATVEAAKKIASRPVVIRNDDWWKEVEELTEQAHAMRARCFAKLGRTK